MCVCVCIQPNWFNWKAFKTKYFNFSVTDQHSDSLIYFEFELFIHCVCMNLTSQNQTIVIRLTKNPKYLFYYFNGAWQLKWFLLVTSQSFTFTLQIASQQVYYLIIITVGREHLTTCIGYLASNLMTLSVLNQWDKRWKSQKLINLYFQVCTYYMPYS